MTILRRKRLLAAQLELPPAAAQRLELEPELAPARFRSSGLLGSQLERPRPQACISRSTLASSLLT